MLPKSIQTTVRRLFNFAQTAGGVALASGILIGICALAWFQQFHAQFGTSLPVLTASGIALAVALAFGSTRSIRVSRTDPVLSFGIAQFGIAAWTVMFPWLSEIPFTLAGRIRAESLAVPLPQFIFLMCTASLLLGLPVYVLARLPDGLLAAWKTLGGPRADRESVVAWTWIGVLCGILASVGAFVPAFGLQAISLTAALAGGAIFLGCVVCAAQSNWQPRSPHPDSTQDELQRLSFRLFSPAEAIWNCATAVAGGCLFALLCRLLDQLMLTASSLLYVKFIAVLAGAGTAWVVHQNGTGRTSHMRWTPGFSATALGAWTLLIFASFGLLIRCSLFVNANVSNALTVLTWRGLLVAGTLFPVGYLVGLACWGRRPGIAARRSRENSTPAADAAQLRLAASFFPGWYSLAIAAGYFATRWFLTPRVAGPNAVLIVVWSLAAIAAIRCLLMRDVPRARWARIGVGCLIVVFVGGSFGVTNYDPALSSKLLFSTNVLVARHSGVRFDRLDQLDEGRNLSVREGDLGTYTLWKYHVTQLHVRENGVPKSVFSGDTHICPHYSGEVLPATIPLVLHEAPRSVLALGLRSGTPISTCLEFPVQNLTCVEADSGLIQLVRDDIAAESGVDPFKDNRTQLWNVDPAFAVACRPGTYDVVLSLPDEAALAQSAPYYCLGFYRRAARWLSADGIFAQRVNYIDFGPEAIQVIARTMQSAFREVLAVEIAPGAMLFLGTNSDAGLIRPKLVARVRAPQVRRVMASFGWDWAMMLNLPAYNDEGLRAIRAPGRFGINTAANARLPFRLPQQVISWGEKQQQVQAILAPQTARFLDWVGEDGNAPDVLRRFSEVAAQRTLIDANPDEPWVYRKAVREQLTTRPLSQIQPVNLEEPDGMHPEDKRRMRYFKVLNDAALDGSPSPETIRRVAALEEPFDPLITFFLHHEVARLFSRSENRNPREELVHRLYSINFSTGGDRSVRNVIGAIELILNEPDALPDPAERWDHLNALLQTLEGRWRNRGETTAMKSRFVLTDIEKSIDASEKSLQEMERLAPLVGITPHAMESRRQVIETNLVRPLRTYRARILPRHFKNLSDTRAALEKVGSEAQQ